MTMRQEDIDYFNRGIVENPCYWSRLGGKPDFTNLVVGDLGCGHGSLCMDVAMSGAKRVIGFGLNARLIDFGNENMHGNYPQLANVVEFRYQDVRESPESDIDCFVSKDTFEHVLDLSQVLDAMKTRLKPGGRIYAGFGPLWNSPFGDHGRLKMRFPWGHVAFSEKHLITRLNRLNGIDGPKAASIHDLGLNKFSLADYRQIFKECGMSVVFFRVNSSTRPISKVFSLICRIPLTREYFSHNIYCILEKPNS